MVWKKIQILNDLFGKHKILFNEPGVERDQSRGRVAELMIKKCEKTMGEHRYGKN